ncbi:hypothetical protein EVAR_43962_1 [Eumeta japonica]|uniref:Uncharacterized protein n=1 Tax=Eumeta variegata TaxID=151549 RepID=A0A4C1XXD9_EUMVA|nr:hypothetical protein EVAR_43962_1 [Eumeta japonica]
MPRELRLTLGRALVDDKSPEDVQPQKSGQNKEGTCHLCPPKLHRNSVYMCDMQYIEPYVCNVQSSSAHLQEIANSHIHQGVRSVKTTDTISLSEPLSCNGQSDESILTSSHRPPPIDMPVKCLPNEDFGVFYENYETLAALKNWSEQQKKAGRLS